MSSMVSNFLSRQKAEDKSEIPLVSLESKDEVSHIVLVWSLYFISVFT